MQVHQRVELTEQEIWGSFYIIPKEIVLEIFSYIQTPDLLQSVAPLNHQWRKFTESDVCVRLELYRFRHLICRLRQQLSLIAKEDRFRVETLYTELTNLEKDCLVEAYRKQFLPLSVFLTYKKRLLLNRLDSVPVEMIKKINLTALWLPCGFQNFINISIERHEVKRILGLYDCQEQVNAISCFLDCPFITTKELELKLEAVMFMDVLSVDEERVLSQINKGLLTTLFKRGEGNRAIEIVSDCDFIVGHIRRTIDILAHLANHSLQSQSLWHFGQQLYTLNCTHYAVEAARYIVEPLVRDDLLTHIFINLCSSENQEENNFSWANRIITYIHDSHTKQLMQDVLIILTLLQKSNSHKRKASENEKYFID